MQTVTLVGGPIVKTHKSTKNGYEGQKHKWGPLGGWCVAVPTTHTATHVNVHKLIVLLLLCAGIDIISSSSATAVLSVCRVIVGRIFLGAVSTSLSCD